MFLPSGIAPTTKLRPLGLTPLGKPLRDDESLGAVRELVPPLVPTALKAVVIQLHLPVKQTDALRHAEARRACAFCILMALPHPAIVHQRLERFLE